jgi:hypothetical protein
VTPARLAARCLELLGPVDGPIAVVGARRLRSAIAARVSVADDGMAATGAVCAFVGLSADPAARRACLNLLTERLSSGAPVVLVDHNRPRRVAAQLVGVLALLARGRAPSRAAYPAARELRAEGFVIDRLRLAAGERIQLIRAHRA